MRLVGVAVGLVLPDGVAPGLAAHRVLQLGGDDRQAVEADDQVDRVLVCEAVVELAGDGEAVRLVEGLGCRVHAVGRGEVGEVELLAVALEAVAQDVERAAGGEGAEQVVEDGGLGLCTEQALELGPRLGLGVAQEGKQLGAVEGQLAVERAGSPLR